jgi:hypothetical protein
MAKKENYSKEVKELVDDLGWDYERMSNSGQETYDKLCEKLGWKFNGGEE